MTTDMKRSSSGLGRGLAALIPQRDEQPTSVELPISAIGRNPYQPRQAFEQTQLDELAASIAEHGVLQPILVTEVPGGYRLIAGERRLRAAEMAGLERIPALVRPADDGAQLSWALIENLQRSDLNAIEEAGAYRRLVDEFGLSHDDVAARVGKSRSAVANSLRLLDLAPDGCFDRYQITRFVSASNRGARPPLEGRQAQGGCARARGRRRSARVGPA